MNWTETFVGAAALFASGLMMARRSADNAIASVLASAAHDSAPDLVVIAGVSMTRSDFAVMLILTGCASAVAASMRFENLRAASINFVLGAIFGFLGAHLLVTVTPIANDAIFGLAPAAALIAAKAARVFISDDAVVDTIFGALFRRRK
jgi:hypothetical protein